MRAIIVETYGEPDVLKLADIPERQPAAGQIAIKVAVTSVNFMDTVIRQGQAGPAGAKPPYTPGMDCAGTVVAVGPDVKRFKVGDRIWAFTDGGSYTEIALARETLCYSLPDKVSFEAGCCPVVLITAWNLLHVATQLKAGESVLVQSASGGVGSLVVQIARLMGAGKIVGVIGDPSKAELVRASGADAVVLKTDFVSKAGAIVGTNGFDLILDANGGDIFNKSLEVLAPFGRIVAYGQASGTPGTIVANLLFNNRSVIGYSSGHYRAANPEALRPSAEAVIAAVANGSLKVTIGGDFDLANASKAHSLIQSGRSSGKVLLRPGQ